MDFFDDEDARREREELANSAGDYLDSLENPQRSYKTFRFFLIVDIAILIFAAFAGNWIYNLRFEIFLYLLALVAGAGFLLAFSAQRLYQKTVSVTRETDSIEKGVMGGFMYASSQDRKYMIWLAAAAAGGVFTGLFLAIAAVSR